MLDRIAKKSTEAQVVDSLRAFVLSGAIAPGTRVTETELSERLGVSRATTRAGLQRLVADGIVVQIPYTGWKIADITSSDAWELWTLRASLEALAARLVAGAMTESVRQRLRTAMAAMTAAAEAPDIVAVNECDFALHRLIITGTNHSRLLEQYLSVERQVRLYIAMSNLLVGDNYQAVVRQHEPLVDALLAGDPDRAAREAWKHNEIEGGKLCAYLDRR